MEPSVLFLDEITSALSSRSEQMFQEVIETAIKRLAVFMSLREATVQEVLDFNALGFADRLWAMTETGNERVAVCEALCEASAREELCFSPRDVADTLWSMTETGIEKLAVFEALCEASAKEVLCFNPHNVADALCAMTETCFERLAVVEALCEASAQFRASTRAFRRRTLGSERGRDREARRLREVVWRSQ